MKIGITGDTHGSMQALRRIAASIYLVDLWLHTGDHAADAHALSKLTGVKTMRVQGNCDPMQEGVLPDEFIVLENFKVWLTHGHRYIQWNEKQDLVYWAKQFDQDIVVYGHTHVPICEVLDGVLLINPGSPSRPRGGSKPCFAVLTLQKGGTPEVEYVEI